MKFYDRIAATIVAIARILLNRPTIYNCQLISNEDPPNEILIVKPSNGEILVIASELEVIPGLRSVINND